MSSKVAIVVRDLSKCHYVYRRPQDRLAQMIFSSKKQRYQEFWALKNVSFEVFKGETIGVLGKNGSGKSTLLQLISGTLDPSGGEIICEGRIAALLELGSGFNPDFTGRENIYLNASILGFSAKEVADSFDSIVEFADIGDFLDRQVKTYSSGMYVRLAFSIAIHVHPDILIIDEALSVGDELFQKKCFDRLKKLKEYGTTIFFVTHSTHIIAEICDRAIFIDRGMVVAVGSAKKIADQYQKFLFGSEVFEEKFNKDSVKFELNSPIYSDEFFDPELIKNIPIFYDAHGVSIKNPYIYDSSNQVVNVLKSGDIYKFKYELIVDVPIEYADCGMMFKTLSGIELGGLGSEGSKNLLNKIEPGNYKISCSFTCNLNQGVYLLNAGCIGSNYSYVGFLHRIVDALAVRVYEKEPSITLGSYLRLLPGGISVE